MERLGLESGMQWGCPSAQWPSPLIESVVLSQVAGFWCKYPKSELALLLLSVYSPLSQHQDPCPRGEQWWSMKGLYSLSVSD